VRADSYCIVKANGLAKIATKGSNCYDAAEDAGRAIPGLNAMDITWKLPANYNIPNDGTTATMTCKNTISSTISNDVSSFTMW